MALNNKESLYHYICRNIVDGRLPKEFSLASDRQPNQIHFADGAMDGIAVYHMAHAEVTEESLKLLESLMRDISNRQFTAAKEKLKQFAAKNTPLNVIDEFEGFIMENKNWIEPDALHDFAMECIMSSDVDDIKYGLEMLELFSEPDEELKNIIRTLGLSDEFTIFSIFNMQSWSGTNDEIFSLAKKVCGWGRIHAISRLEPANAEIKRWLLEEGVVNDVIPDYSALEVYQKADVRTLLTAKLPEEDLPYIAAIICALLSEEPVAGISAVDDADQMILDFLKQVKKAKPNLDLCNAVYQIAAAERSNEVTAATEQILHSEEVRNLVACLVKDGKAVDLAEYLGIDYLEPLYRCLEKDFDKSYYQCSYLMRSDDYREKTIEIFRKNLPTKKITAGPEDNIGLGKEYENYSKMDFMIQELRDYPLCGTDFIVLALKSPVIRNRNMALRVLDSWCKLQNCSLKELSEEVFQAVNKLKASECSDSVLKNIAEYGF